MSLYDCISDLPVRVDSVEFETREREIAGGYTRTTTVVIIHGEDETGSGEDVTYESEDHYALADSNVATDLAPMGEYAYQEWSHALDGIDLFPDHGPSPGDLSTLPPVGVRERRTRSCVEAGGHDPRGRVRS